MFSLCISLWSFIWRGNFSETSLIFQINKKINDHKGMHSKNIYKEVDAATKVNHFKKNMEAILEPVHVSDQDYQELTEGMAKITFLGSAKAFYNPVQEFNRDLTVTVLRQFVADRLEEDSKYRDCVNGSADEPLTKRKKIEGGKHRKKDAPIRILDALSASGLRALRFAKEVPNVGYVCANDFSDNAVKSIDRNIKVNGVEDIVKSNFGDALEVMMSHRNVNKRFQSIDLDPYGSPSVFLDSAVQAVEDEGLLMITCTDMATLCGNTPEACYNKYNSVPLKHKCCHEGALRILLRCIDSHANRYGRYIEPLLSVSIDFYIRVFVKIHTGQVHAKDSVAKIGYVFSCTGCQSLSTQPLVKKTVDGKSVKFTPSTFKADIFEGSSTNGKCRHCGSSVHINGPMYLAPMHNENFVKKLLDQLNSTKEENRLGTHRRLLGTLSVISEEIHEVPFYYELSQFFHVVKSPICRLIDFRSALLNAGYRSSISHANSKSIKTDAPMDFIWDIAKSKGIEKHSIAEKLPGHAILAKEISHIINFTYNKEANAKSRSDGLLRFQDNKGKNWGPKSKAKGSVNSIKAGYHVEEDSEQRKVSRIDNM